jgi:phosphatidylglycerophosphatase C
MSEAKMSIPDRPVVAAFDFDGTLTNHDSFIRFLAWRRAPLQLFLDLTLTSPLLALYLARLTGNETHKMALFARQFAGESLETYQGLAREFARTQIPSLIRPEALRRLRFHRSQGHRLVIITASFPEWIAPWAETEGVTAVLGSHVESREHRLTGRQNGPNCHGAEKVRRLLAEFPDRKAYRLFAYGDSRGDRELLAAADEAYFRRFS